MYIHTYVINIYLQKIKFIHGCILFSYTTNLQFPTRVRYGVRTVCTEIIILKIFKFEDYFHSDLLLF